MKDLRTSALVLGLACLASACQGPLAEKIAMGGPNVGPPSEEVAVGEPDFMWKDRLNGATPVRTVGRSVPGCVEQQELTVRGVISDSDVAALVERVEAFSPHFQVRIVGANEALARVEAVPLCTARDPYSGQDFNFVAASDHGKVIWVLEFASSWRH